MDADCTVEWTRDLGDGRLLVMERVAVGYRATLAEFSGVGSTEEATLDDLLVQIEDYSAAAHNLRRAISPGGHLHESMRRLRRLVNQIVDRRTNEGT